MADIRKRVSKRTGKVTYQARYKDASGKPRYVTKPTRKLVVAELQRITKELEQGTHVHDRDSITVGEALDIWIEACEKVGRHGREPVTPGTLRKYKERAENHLKPLIGGKMLSRLTGPDVVKLRDDLIKRCGRPTAAKALTDFKSALGEAHSRGLIGSTPAAGVTIRQSGRQVKAVPIPTAEEMDRIERAIEARGRTTDKRTAKHWPRYRALLWTLRLAGMRPEEARALRRRDVLLDSDQIRVSQAADEDGEIGPLKTAAGYRIIGVPPFLTAVLRLRLRDIPDKPDALLFGTGAGNPETLPNITNRAWYPVLKAAGVEGYPLYSLRHYRISERLIDKEDLLTVSEQAGHADAGFTLKTYAHVIRDRKGEARVANMWRAGAKAAIIIAEP